MTDETLETCCAVLWAKDYPEGGSMYKTYESTPFHDKELYRAEVKAIVTRWNNFTGEQAEREDISPIKANGIETQPNT